MFTLFSQYHLLLGLIVPAATPNLRSHYPTQFKHTTADRALTLDNKDNNGISKRTG